MSRHTHRSATGTAALLAAALAGLVLAPGPAPVAAKPKAGAAPRAAGAGGRCPPSMLAVPAGELVLDDGDGESGAVGAGAGGRRVRVAAFCIDRTEVTAGAAPCPDDEADMPAGCLTAEAAEAYCRTRKARLPSDDEWEMAARGPHPQRFPWGDAAAAPGGAVCVGKIARTDEPTAIGPCAAGASPGDRSPFGAMDLEGNLPEWTSTSACDPTEPACGERVVRGGGWSDDAPAALRDRRRARPASTEGIGFRCAADSGSGSGSGAGAPSKK